MTINKFIELHDSCISQITFGTDFLELRFLLETGKTRILNIRDIEYMCADHVREGNIVFECIVYQGEDAPDEVLKKLCDGIGLKSVQEFSTFKQGFLSSGQFLTYIGPSYGAVVVASSKQMPQLN